MSWDYIIETHALADEICSEQTSIVPLRDYQLIIVSGDDSESFLQGQCTCDFTQLLKNHIVMGAHCTHKGRMNSSFHALRLDEKTIGLRVHKSIADYAKNALQKYAVFSKVSIDITDNYYLFGVIGDRPSEHLAKHIKLPPAGEFCSTQDYIVAAHQHNQIEVWCHEPWLKAWLSLDNTIPLQASSNAWRLMNIRRGIGEVVAENLDQLLPQELNFQLVNGISFKKGCYTGQEIVARLHYRGQLKKHLYRGYTASDSAPSVNDMITNAKNKGVIVNVAECGISEYEFLALCDSTMYNTDSCVLEKNSAAKIQWKSLPYAIN